MGLFGRKKKTTDAVDTVKPQPQHLVVSNSSSDSITKKSSRSIDNSLHKRVKGEDAQSTEPAMEDLSILISELENSLDTSSEKPAQALRKLFALSEHAENDNRVQMVKFEDGRLVSCLLAFLSRCEHRSSEQYLTLLVVNNISIPSENKRTIALEKKGAEICSKLLCNDPSCHLLAIILVNLTFADPGLRKDFISSHSSNGLIESLCFALRVASLTREEYNSRSAYIAEISEATQSAAHRLANLMAEDQRLRPAKKSVTLQSGGIVNDDILCPSDHVFPETARWCLSALRNLTRPCKDATAAHILIKSGMFSVLLRYLIVTGGRDNSDAATSGGNSTSSDTASIEAVDEVANPPTTWDSSSLQDAALYIVMNLAACPSSRDYINDDDTLNILSTITESPKFKRSEISDKELQHQNFQCLKARMTLAYLMGSSGHFGQGKISSTASTVVASPPDSPLVLSEVEINLLIELLANTLHGRGKSGSGGYSAATYNIKYVVLAVRCILTHNDNQNRMSKVAGRKLNILLTKILAFHSCGGQLSHDAELAEFACFTLYIQSNYGFQMPFLPASFTDENDKNSFFAKAISSYLLMPSITPAGRHAAEQLLMREKWLVFGGTVKDLVVDENAPASLVDLSFPAEILSKAERVDVGNRIWCEKPSMKIFDRPIVRRRIRQRSNTSSNSMERNASVAVFPSALQAVQQLSYGSNIVRHAGFIDDMMIANNIASSADGDKAESYHYLWSWEDKVNEIQKNLERQSSQERSGRFSLRRGSTRLNSQRSLETEPISIFGLTCASACGADTTV